MMKRNELLRRLCAVLAALLIMLTFSACGGGAGGPDNDGPSDGDGTITIVATIFPGYDWARTVIGDEVLAEGNISLTLLMDNGVDLHSYQPSAADLLSIKNCDMLIYVGGESDAWIEDALREDANPDMVVIRMMDSVGDRAKTEEVIEGMTESEEDEHGHDDGDAEEAEEEEEYDEHVWLSLRNAGLITNDIGEALAGLDAENAAVYRENAAALISEMDALDKQYEEAVSAGKHKTLVFGDRFPFRYMTDDYGLTYYAAFVGCSAESEASFETIRFLAEKVDEEGLSYVLAESSNGERISKTIIETTSTKDQEILLMDDMQSHSPAEADLSYIDRMSNNLETLKKAME